MPRPEPQAVLPLELQAVSVDTGGQRVLDALSCRFEAGPCSVVLGPNGAGKTMLLRVLCGLLPPSQGRLAWLGPAGARAADALALVRQRPVLLRRSVARNVDYALRLRGVPKAERARRTRRVLEATGLDTLAGQGARRLSVGQQQRLALARAWALEPEVLFLDEPASALDPAGSRALEAAIRAVQVDGTKIVMTTHDLGQARRMAGEVLFLHRGRLLEQTPAEEFFRQPRSAEAKAFLEGELLW